MDECMNDDVRLRGTPFGVYVVCACCPCHCVCPFSRAGSCARSHRTGLCQHAFPEGETSVRRPRMTGHTHPTSVRCKTRILLSPACLGTKAASARSVNPCREDLFRQRLPAVRRTFLPWCVCCLVSCPCLSFLCVCGLQCARCLSLRVWRRVAAASHP